MRILLIAALAAGALLAAPAAAGASSIVFAKNGNVWLANPDGSGQYQVTLDGTPGDPYESPSQADDGTIMAVRGDGRDRLLYRMRQNGQLLNAPVPTVARPDDPRLSPDGSRAAYWFLSATTYFGCDYCIGIYGQTIYTHPDRLTRYEEVPEPYCCYRPSWVGNEGVLMDSSAAIIWFHRYGSADETAEWFDDVQTFNDTQELTDPELSSGRDKLAVVRGDSRETLQLYAVSGAPPTSSATPAPGCRFENPTGLFESPSWAPDGSGLVWQEDDGIWMSPIPSTSDCAAVTAAGGARLLIPGGSKPDWGPANVNPGPRPATPDTTTPDTGSDTGSQVDTGPGSTTVTDSRRPAIEFGVRRQRLGRALKKGWSTSFTADEPGRAELKLTVTGSAARGLRIARTVSVARGVKNAKAGRNTIVAKFTRKAKRKLRRARRVKATAVLTLTDAAGNRTTKRRKVTLAR